MLSSSVLAQRFTHEVEPMFISADQQTRDDLTAVTAAISECTVVDLLIPEAGGSNAVSIIHKTPSAQTWWAFINPDGFYDSL